MKVLVIEDESSIRNLFKDMILSWGYKCDASSNGMDAYRTLKDGNVYDVILSDHNMPMMTGLELRLKIENEFDCCPPFIIISGNIHEIDKNKYEKLFYCLLEKPKDISLIEVKLKEIKQKKSSI